MIRSYANIMLNRGKKYIDPESIPKYINQLDKPYIYHSMLMCKKRNKNNQRNFDGDDDKRKVKLIEEAIYYIDICRFNQQILPQGFPKTPVLGCAGLARTSNKGNIKYVRGYPGGTFEGREDIICHVKWRNKTGYPLKVHSHIDMNNICNLEPAPYSYHCSNKYMSFYGIYLIKEGKRKTQLNYFASLDLPSKKYEYPLIIEDCTFYKDGSLINSGEVILVNGKAWPSLDVKRRQYRFYILNGSASRVFKLMLSNEMYFTVIGGNKGLLPSPIRKKEILLAPGEIVDLLIDFSRQPKGCEIILTNIAGTPFPDGYLPNPETSGQIMRFLIPENDAFSITPVRLPDKLRL